MNAINIRDIHMKSTGHKSNRSKLRSVPQSRRRRNVVQDYYPQSRRRRNTVLDYYPQSRRRRNTVQDYYPQSRRRRNTVQDYYPQSRRRRNTVLDYYPQSRRRRNAVLDYYPQSRRRRNAVQDYYPQSRRRRNAVQDYYPQSRRRRNSVQDYYVDVVAMIDYKRYSKFLAQANYNNFAAMQTILEYYALVFSGTVASSSFIDRDASYDEMNADTAIDNLQAFNIGSGSSIVGIYDHVMLLG
nr:ADAM family mig-17-like; partial [Biomphalaria glabrata]